MSRGVADYDLVVIGAGAAGLTAAGAAAAIGAKTALIEAERFGGDCTWHGCVPSKALLRAADAAAEIRRAARFGVDGRLVVDGTRVMTRVRQIREHIYADADAPEALHKYGIATFSARARFLDAHTIALEGDAPTRMTARRFVLATGSRPNSLDIGVPTLDTDSVWDIPTLPSRLLIVGGGPVATELAQAFARLGSNVTLVTQSHTILARDEPRAMEIIARALREDGVTIRTDARVSRASESSGTITVELSDGSRLCVDRILAAVGRQASVADLGLDVAGVAVRNDLIAIDRRCRTTARHIYAAGDCATSARFTHVAERMASVAIMNAIVGVPTSFDERSITWTTFTQPELAQVGPTQCELGREGRHFVAQSFPSAKLDRAIVDDAGDGYAAILSTKGGRVLAGTIVGPRAGDSIAEIGLARERRLSVSDLASTLHVYPTYAIGVRRAADSALIRSRTALVIGVLRIVRRLRGTAPQLETLLPETP